MDTYYKTTAHAHTPLTNSIYLTYRGRIQTSHTLLCSLLSKPFTLQSNQVLSCKGVSTLEKAGGGGKRNIHQKEISFQNFSHLLVFKDWVLQTLLLMPESQSDSEFSYPECGCKQPPGRHKNRHPAGPQLFIMILKLKAPQTHLMHKLKISFSTQFHLQLLQLSLHSASSCWSSMGFGDLTWE